METRTFALALVVVICCVVVRATAMDLLNNISDSSAIVSQQNRTSGRSIVESFSSFMTNGLSDLLYTLADNPLKGFPGLDPDECVKRSICEAHNHPDAYGWLAFPLQLLFPPYSGSQRDDDDQSYYSKYRLAARYGKSDNADCARQYWGCMFNPLSVIQRILDWLF